MNKMFDFGRHPGRKDTTEPTADTIITVPDPMFKGSQKGREFVLTLLHKALQKQSKLQDQRLQDGGEKTSVDLTPELKGTTPIKSAPRGSSLAARQLAPNSRPAPIDPLKFYESTVVEDVLLRVLDRQKKKRRSVKLPVDLTKSGTGIWPEPLRESTQQRLQACREMLHLLSEMDREKINGRAKSICRWVREVRAPIVAQREHIWEMARLERERQRQEIKEGIAAALGVLGRGIAKSAAKQAFGSGIVDLASQAIRAATKRPKPLRIVTGHPKKPKQLKTPISGNDDMSLKSTSMSSGSAAQQP